MIRMLLRVTEAADQLSVSRAKVYELIRSGELATCGSTALDESACVILRRSSRV